MSSLGLAAASLSLVLLSAACGGDKAADVDGGVAVDAAIELDATPPVVRTICLSSPGTRLSRQYFEPSEGARQERPVVDTLYGTECRFVAEPDGKYTCYPRSVLQGQLLYTDAACDNPVIGVVANTAPADFHRLVTTAGACNEATYTHRKIGQQQNVATLYSFAANCQEALVAPATDYYAVGEVIERIGFVGAAYGPIRESTRLSTQAFSGDDGSVTCSHFRAYDSVLAMECTAGTAADTVVRCVPSAVGSILVHSEATCASPAVETSQTGVCFAAPTHVISGRDPLDCGYEARHYKPVTQTVLAAWYAPTTCQERTVADVVVALAGTEVPAADFADFVPVVEAGAGRLHRIIVNHGEEFGAFTKIWHDDKIDQDCTFLTATDGALRCLPAGMNLTSGRYYTDGACTDGITLAVAETCQVDSSYFTADVPAGRRVFASRAYTDTLWELVDAVCTPVVGAFYERVHEVAPSSFVAAEILLPPTQ